MRDIVWGQVLSVEVDEIDEDHHKLIDIFNILNHAFAEGESHVYLAAVLEELVNCTVWHFSHEERLMLKYGYEGMDEHKAIHRELIKSVEELQQRILQADSTMSDKDIEFLEQWLTEHILTEDMRLGAYLSQGNVPIRPSIGVSSLKIGWGKTKLLLDDDDRYSDNIMSLIPEIGVELNVTKFFHISFSGGTLGAPLRPSTSATCS